MTYRLSSLLDIPRLQAILDNLHAVAGISSSVLDVDGTILTRSGWQDICRKFHRAFPESEKLCIESNLRLSWRTRGVREPAMHECPHGLMDTAFPIVVDGAHLGNVFTGQILLKEPDLEFFRSQARRYGFDEEAYLAAVKKVPVVKEGPIREQVALVARFTEMLAETGYSRLREKEAREKRDATIELLDICNRARGLKELMRELMLYFARITGCEAVGVRLRQGDDYPYFETRGFPAEFVLVENTLCAHDPAGEPVRDASGHPALDCMCGNVLRGRFDPSKPFFTDRGSFWSSHTSELLATTTEADRKARTRNRCNGEGYESVALIPLRTQGEIVGLFQFNDRRKGRFTTEKIALLEELVSYVAIALSKMTAETALRISRQQHRSLFDNMMEGYAYCQAVMEDGRCRDFTYLDVNEAFGRLTGLKDVVGRNVTEVVPGLREANPELFEILGRVASTGKPEQFEMYLAPMAAWYSISAYSPEPGCFIAVFDNVTEKMELEERLRQSQKMDAVGRLAGGVAHDFNNLLTVINGSSELLLGELDPASPLRQEAEEIRKAGERATSLTRQLLAFSRRQMLQPRILDLNETVSGIEPMLRRLIGENIALRIDLGEGLGKVKADPAQIDQVILNLAVNARDAMPGGGTLTLRTADVPYDERFGKRHPSAVPGPHVLLSVEDTGTGIRKEVLERIFEPFFTTKPKGAGTGLGLSTVFGIVQQSQGHIDVRSEVGKGTAFEVLLPRTEGEVESQPPVPPEPARGNATVLLVEDEDSVRKIIDRILSGNGYRVILAREGGEALSISAEHAGPIDLLITDVVMPGIGGRELAARIGRSHPGIPVLYISGYTDEAVSHRGLLDTGIPFLQKPFTSGALLRKVAEVIGNKRSA
ncbi:MAG: PocR ligand-binding domain-containing protein [Thermodesulfobacteriota bacterium]